MSLGIGSGVLETTYPIAMALQHYLPNSELNVNREMMEKTTATVEQYMKLSFEVNKSRMQKHGSPEELIENLQRFQNFTGVHTAFEYLECILFTTSPLNYQNEKGELFLNSQDIFPVLQAAIVEKFELLEHGIPAISCAILASYLKTNEIEHKKIFGLLSVPCDLKSYIETSINEFQTSYSKKKQNERHVSYRNEEDLLRHVSSILPNFKKFVPEYGRLILLIRDHWKANPRDSRKYQPMVSEMKMIIEFVNSFMKSHQHLFKPPSTTQQPDQIKYVRLFEDGSRKFIMSEEVSLNPKAAMDESVPYLETIEEEELEEYCRGFKDTMSPIELIKVPILRTKNCAIPIRTHDEGHCELAVDLLFETIRSMIFGLHIFEKLKKEEWSIVERVFQKLGGIFNHLKDKIYFLRLRDYEGVAQEALCLFDKFQNRPTEGDWSVSDDGFTAQDLRDKLVELGFTELFPNITDFADVAHARVDNVKTEKILRTCDLCDAVEHCLLIVLFQKFPNLTEFLKIQNGAHRLLITLPPPYRTYRHQQTKLEGLNFFDVEVESIREDEENYGKIDKKLVRSNGEVLYYNDSAYATMVIGLVGQFPDKIRDVIANYNLDYNVFLMNQDDVDWLTNEFAKESPVEVRIPQGFDVTTTLSLFTEHVPHKKLYLRCFPHTTMIRRIYESDDKDCFQDSWIQENVVFYAEAVTVLLSALEQQGDTKNPERINYLLKLHTDLINKKLIQMNFTELNLLFELLDIDKSRITVVPDISFVDCVKNRKPCRIIGPEREELMKKSQALFQIFRDVVCDVNWSEPDGPNNSMLAFHTAILKTMQMVVWTADNYVQIRLVERCVENLKNHPHYLERKKKMLITPLMKLSGTADDLCIRLSDALPEIEKLGIDPSFRSGSPETIEVWKYRLIFYNHWARMFFDENHNMSRYLCDTMYDIIPPSRLRDEEENMLCKTMTLGELVQKSSDFRGPLLPHVPKVHEWFEGTPEVGQFFQTDHNEEQKPEDSKAPVELRTPPKDEDQTTLGEPSTQKKKKKKSKKTTPESESPVLKEEASECCKTSLEAQRKEMDEVKLMVKMLQEEVQRMRVSTESKDNLAAAEREAKLIKKCQRTSELCNEKTAELEATKRKLEKVEKAEAVAQRTLKEMQEKEKKRPTREELEKELEKLKMQAEKAEQEKIEEQEKFKRKVEEMEQDMTNQAQLHQGSASRIEELTAEVQRLQSAAETSTEQFALRLSELETYSNDKDGFIRLLKGQLPPETLADMDISLPLEMSRLFHNLLHQEDKLRVEDEAANRKVVELKLKTRGENELHRRAEWWLVDFQDKCREYRAVLTENIRRIRADHFITKAELVTQPDYPVLSEVITSALDRARRVYNAELDAECSICLDAEERDWWRCSGCLKKCHQDCIDKAWAASDVQRCPHCQRLVN